MTKKKKKIVSKQLIEFLSCKVDLYIHVIDPFPFYVILTLIIFIFLEWDFTFNSKYKQELMAINESKSTL